MSSIVQIQDRLNDIIGQLTVLDLAFSSPRIADCLEENEIIGFSAIIAEASDTLESVVSELDARKPHYTPEEKQKFAKAVQTITRLRQAIDPKLAVN